MKLPRRKRDLLHRRILIVFVLAIALPGGYVGFRGLRSVFQEQELQRAILVQSLNRTLEFEIEKIERTLKESEASVARILVSSRPSRFLDTVADGLESRPWIEDAFVFDSHLNVLRPVPFASKTLANQHSPISEQDVRERVEAAAQLEAHGDCSAAESSYQQLLHGQLSRQSRIAVNTYLARAALGAGDQEIARQAYKTIIRTDSTFSTSRPICYAGFAWVESIEDLANRGRPAEALQMAVKFYGRLLDFYFKLSSEQHHYFLQRVHSQIESLTASSTPAAGLRNTLRCLEERERNCTRVFARAGRIASWLRTKHAALSVADSANRVRHFGLTLEGEFLPLTMVDASGPVLGERWVAFIVRPAMIERDFLLPALEAGDWARDFVVAVRRDTSGVPHRDELVRSQMHETAVWFPSLTISVTPNAASTIEFLGIGSPVLASIGLASLVLGVILIGIFIIYRDLHREEELAKMKSEFISNVSHELKSPIAAIRMLADNLRERRVESDVRQMEYYELISRESGRLSHLIENILDFSRIEERRKAFRLEKRDVAEIVCGTVCRFKSLAGERAHDITLDVEEEVPGVLVDPDALTLAIFNLLDNAVKYSERDTPISVRLSRRNGDVCIDVEDHGVGIPKKEQKKIFEKFYRVLDNEGKKTAGSGIGLTLVKEIAQAHRGRVAVHSQPGIGSTFQLLLPIGE